MPVPLNVAWKPRMDDARSLASRWVRKEILELEAYAVPPFDGPVKLDAMENPHGWPPALTDAWLAQLQTVELNRYPDPQASALVPGLRRFFSVPDAARVMLGNGSDELIQLLCLALNRPGATMLMPEPSFSMYGMIARFTGMRCEGVPLRRDDFGLDVPAMLAAIKRLQPALVMLARPNNPTGNRFAPEALEAVLEAAPGLVVVDEAYAPFAGDSVMAWLERWPNLLVMATVSKIGLAGLRLGLLAGPPAWLEQFDKLRLPYNINSLTQASAAFALRHEDELRVRIARVCEDREVLFQALASRGDLDVWPSEANFLLVRLHGRDAARVHSGLRAQGVLVKNLDGSHPALTACLRITVGTSEENRQLLKALDLVSGVDSDQE